jgi:hypothetical protein
MSEVAVLVMQKGLDYTSRAHRNEAKISLRAPSPDLAPQLSTLNVGHHWTLRLYLTETWFVDLVVGDFGAIHRAHQRNPHQVRDFDALYNLLARKPNLGARLRCEFIGPVMET